MKLSKKGLDLICSFEGYLKKQPDGSCKAYRCPAGVWTCGYGCTEGVGPNTHWTREEADGKFAAELAKFERAVDRLVKVELNQNQYDALVSFSYNCGEGALQKSTILKKLNKGDYAGACAGFAAWNKATVKGKRVVLRGLTRRRAAEAALFAERVAQDDDDEDIPTEGMMPQWIATPRSEKVAAAVNAGGNAGGGGLLGFFSGRASNPSPETFKQTIGKGSEYRQLADEGASLFMWGFANPVLVVVVGLAFVAVCGPWVFSKIRGTP